jgi:hypothetical protein
MEEPYLGMYTTRFFDVEEGLGGAESRGIWGVPISYQNSSHHVSIFWIEFGGGY